MEELYYLAAERDRLAMGSNTLFMRSVALKRHSLGEGGSKSA